MTGKFVILRHTGHGDEHWDFMLETDDALATWQCSADPADLSPGQGLVCKQLPPHRRAYLTYEGPVRQGRGQVRRTEAGTYEDTSTKENERNLFLRGQTMTGRFALQREAAGDAWRLSRL